MENLIVQSFLFSLNIQRENKTFKNSETGVTRFFIWNKYEIYSYILYNAELKLVMKVKLAIKISSASKLIQIISVYQG